MKTGRIGKFTLALGSVIVIIYGLRLYFLPTTVNEQHELVLTAKNRQQAQALPDFSAIKDIPSRKQAFFDYLRPIVQKRNTIIGEQRSFLTSTQRTLEEGHQLDNAARFRVKKIAKEYQFSFTRINKKTIRNLLKRVDVVPIDLVLVQAANESGWGSSRFAREGLNFFGQWCFTKGCGLVPSSRTKGLSHEVSVFDSVEDSIASYMRNLNSNGAYRLFRSIRADLRNQGFEPAAAELAYGLINYSERQEAYIDELLDMLRHNKKYLVKK
ncbi:glucosaminidase [Parashewanella spongiae]|uniref:Glucosaminidase n=1 Tax=Parashewanella spongiae TaxID=342950 RepID=A0A3A6U3N2_9GAMM|nr:glucosaminidase domain-containing protein [Parashewanella spongiae]MCL1077249.1 glucosaminidase domain-containing protein [Parashewanella spongiae]RJY18672.1 glucosaminidase [Parashewanella spongiae]